MKPGRLEIPTFCGPRNLFVRCTVPPSLITRNPAHRALEALCHLSLVSYFNLPLTSVFKPSTVLLGVASKIITSPSPLVFQRTPGEAQRLPRCQEPRSSSLVCHVTQGVHVVRQSDNPPVATGVEAGHDPRAVGTNVLATPLAHARLRHVEWRRDQGLRPTPLIRTRLPTGSYDPSASVVYSFTGQDVGDKVTQRSKRQRRSISFGDCAELCCKDVPLEHANARSMLKSSHNSLNPCNRMQSLPTHRGHKGSTIEEKPFAVPGACAH